MCVTVISLLVESQPTSIPPQSACQRSRSFSKGASSEPPDHAEWAPDGLMEFITDKVNGTNHSLRAADLKD